MKDAILFVLVVMISSSCNNHHKKGGSTDNSLPACLKKNMEEIRNGTEKFPPIAINEYSYRGKKVFLYSADCCDQFDIVIDENCQTICAPSGGLEGTGDHRCDSFFAESKLVRNIWKKPE